MLCEILAEATLNDEQKLCKIKKVCYGSTRDNYSCWLIPIDSVDIKSSTSETTTVIKAEENVADEDISNDKQRTKTQNMENCILRNPSDAILWTINIIAIIVFTLCILFLFKK